MTEHDPKTTALLALNDLAMGDDPLLACTARLLRDLSQVTEQWVEDEHRRLRAKGKGSRRDSAIIIQAYCKAVGVCAGASLGHLIKPGGEARMATECAAIFVQQMLELAEAKRKLRAGR